MADQQAGTVPPPWWTLRWPKTDLLHRNGAAANGPRTVWSGL